MPAPLRKMRAKNLADLVEMFVLAVAADEPIRR